LTYRQKITYYVAIYHLRNKLRYFKIYVRVLLNVTDVRQRVQKSKESIPLPI